MFLPFTATAFTILLKMREKLFSDRKIDQTAEAAICAFLAELSEENLIILAQEIALTAAV